MKHLLAYINMGAMQFPFHIFGGVFGAVMMIEGNSIPHSVITGVLAAAFGLAGSALHVWYSNRKLVVTTGLSRDKQIDDRTVRLFDDMEGHYKELLKDKDLTIKDLRAVIKQKDTLIEGHKMLAEATAKVSLPTDALPV